MHNLSRKTKSVISSEGPLISRNPNAKKRVTEAVKLSEVLLEFGEHYLPGPEDKLAFRECFSRCVIAWNLSFLSEAPRQSKLLRAASIYEPTIRAEFMADLIMLIDRKLSLFSEDARCVKDYELSLIGKNASLSVASYPFVKKM